MANLRIISVIGLGYVGLPLAVCISKKHKVIGYDIDKNRIGELCNSFDKTHECSVEEIKNSNIQFTSDISAIQSSDFVIVTVPTPIFKNKEPDLTYVVNATKELSKFIKKGSIIIYESTVYPGVTEEVCMPLIEEISGLKFNKDFYLGYSPERINPGDKTHTIDKVVKVVSGSNDYATSQIDEMYSSVIEAGTFVAASIRTAEAAKVIENTQRDLNIALMNELSQIFGSMNIKINEVLEAANTKWNFLPFEPGLVGGHCIGVDPYYLTYAASKLNFKPKLILAGRATNENMSYYIASKFVNEVNLRFDHYAEGLKILILGLTFKENVPDLRNSKVFDLIDHLVSFNLSVDVFDPLISKEDLSHDINFNLVDTLEEKNYCGIIAAVKHNDFKTFSSSFMESILLDNGVIMDLKGAFAFKTDLTL